MANFENNGVNLHFEYHPPKTGKEVIVFINSLGSDFMIWNEVCDQLKGEYGVLLYDKRGHGKSDIGNTPCSIEDHSTDLKNLLSYLGIDQVIVCGLSIGGLIALSLFRKNPNLIRGCIFCCTAHKIGTTEAWLSRIDILKEKGIEAIADATMERWFTESFRNEKPELLAKYRNMLTTSPLEGYIASCYAIAEADYTDTAQSMNIPTLCIAGDGDGSTPPEVVDSLNKLLPDSNELHIYQDCAHIPCVQQPLKLTKDIKAFSEKLRT